MCFPLLDNILKDGMVAQGACACKEVHLFLFVICSASEEKIAGGLGYK